jgi:hypothetical protein
MSPREWAHIRWPGFFASAGAMRKGARGVILCGGNSDAPVLAEIRWYARRLISAPAAILWRHGHASRAYRRHRAGRN